MTRLPCMELCAYIVLYVLSKELLRASEDELDL